jgi:hypothetical protein
MGNREAKNWQDEAQQILEKIVCPVLPGLLSPCFADSVVLDGMILEGPLNHTSHRANRRP